jgi:predicted NAD/FAD-binding protein
MSMSIRVDGTPDQRGIEYAGALGARGLFPSVRNLLDLAYLRMLTEVKRFHRHATEILASPVDPEGDEETLRAFVARVGLSEYFTTRFLRPLVAAVWSCDPARALDYPARYLFAFLDHHGMLTVFGSPTWRTVVGGSRCYVEKVAAGLDEVRVGRAVTGVVETDDAVWVTDATGDTDAYDAVVLAGHPHQSLAMLTQPSAAQREVLGAMTYTTNHAQLHTDESVLPTRRAARASWNYWQRPDDDREPVLGHLRHLPPDGHRRAGPPVPRHPRRRGPRRPGHGYRHDDLRASALHAGDPCGATEAAEHHHVAHRLSPAPTTAGASTKDGALSGVVAARHLGVEWANVADRDAAVAVAS